MRTDIIALACFVAGAGAALICSPYIHTSIYQEGYEEAAAQNCGYHVEPGYINDEGEGLSPVDALKEALKGSKIYRIREMQAQMNTKNGHTTLREVK